MSCAALDGATRRAEPQLGQVLVNPRSFPRRRLGAGCNKRPFPATCQEIAKPDGGILNVPLEQTCRRVGVADADCSQNGAVFALGAVTVIAGKPYHPMTRGKIERWHLSLKNRLLLENYDLPGDLEGAIADFVTTTIRT